MQHHLTPKGLRRIIELEMIDSELINKFNDNVGAKITYQAKKMFKHPLDAEIGIRFYFVIDALTKIKLYENHHKTS